ncbi:MAG: phosphodiester glycosidase family protein [Bacteroidales bacterium]
MKRIYLLLSIFFLLTIIGVAQQDSLIFTSVEWENQDIHKGLTWEKYHFKNKELFNSNQNINILELVPTANKLSLAFVCSDSLETTSQLGVRSKAVAGVNGSYFKMRGEDPDNHPELTKVPKSSPSKIAINRSIMYMKLDGKLITENKAGHPHVKRYPRGVLAIGNDVSIIKVDTSVENWESTLSADNIITAGPVLLSSGQQIDIPDDAFSNNRHPRTAIGIRADGVVLLVVVDGRSAESYGMSLEELQKTMLWLGCVDAINFDGGGSSTMYVKGQSFNGVVSCPSDNKKFDHKGEREVANAIMILAE